MILAYGGRRLLDNEAMVTFFGQGKVYNPRGSVQIVRRRMVIEGEIIGSSQAEIDERITDIKTMFAIDGGACYLLQSDGETTTNFEIGEGSISGCRIIEGPTFLAQDGRAHFCTGLPFMLALEADYLNTANEMVSYSETIVRLGRGGPRKATIELDNGDPIKQTVSSKTPIIIVQSGQAVGLTAYPVPNAALFPDDIDDPEDEQIIEDAPRYDRGVWLDYSVRWSYRFTLTSNVGIPHPLKR